ncbi:alpha/beta hydrolase [Aquisalimonas asiatica]|nr:alpha/beta hydrolase [Aquisalimonas asiatica]
MPRAAFLLLIVLFLAACAGSVERPVGPGPETPQLNDDTITAADGYRLPLHRWLPDTAPRAVVLALHGFNDHGGAFGVLADGLNEQGMALYAYDQRGFGGSEPRGIWPGRDLLVNDAITATELLAQRYPGKPLFLMGKSMGGAVVMLTLTDDHAPVVAGSVLIAPAVWGEETMPWYQQFGLWLGETLTPGIRLSVDLAQALGNEPTDDDAVLEALKADPMVQREARIDTIESLSELMDEALVASADLPGPALILYGDEDQIIPADPVCLMLGKLPDPDFRPWRMVLYPGGYHMLTRYTGADQVHADINAWLRDIGGALPSGHEVGRPEAQRLLCS